jgi:uncharacterized phage protein (TIGR01671 family)
MGAAFFLNQIIMPREIKFRGLYKGHMVHGNLIDGIGPEGKRFFQIERSDASDYAIYDVDGETVGQYTGLKDKNGNWIYEGDRIRAFQSDGTEVIHVVSYSEKEARFIVTCECYGNLFGGFDQDWINKFKKEVIGNIYETPAP